MAQSISLYEALEVMSRGLGKPVLYISFLLPDIDNVTEWEACFAGLRQAAPYLFDGDTCNS